MAISSAFKSAYTNEVNQQNQGLNTITSGVKDLATVVAGAVGFSGGLGNGIVSQASKHALAGRVGGIGGNIMLMALQEKKDTAKANKEAEQVFSREEVESEINSLKGNPINNPAGKQLNTVFETLQMAKQEELINKKGNLETSFGDVDPNSELGKKILGGLNNDNDRERS